VRFINHKSLLVAAEREYLRHIDPTQTKDTSYRHDLPRVTENLVATDFRRCAGKTGFPVFVASEFCLSRVVAEYQHN
jgi:hypothetical protein